MRNVVVISLITATHDPIITMQPEHDSCPQQQSKRNSDSHWDYPTRVRFA
jgi:hypothetical protein